MCGRYVMARASGDLVGELDLSTPPAFELPPNWNVAPTSTVPILLERFDEAGTALRELHLARWGLLPIWAKDKTFSSRTFNARSETAAEKASFRSAVKTKRCAVPAEAYYEWKTEGKANFPHAIRPADGGLILFAGLYEWWKDPDGGDEPWVLSCSILTGPSPSPDAPGVLGELGALHDRLPLAMTRESAEAWIAPGERSREEQEAVLEQLRAEAFDVARGWEVYPVDKAVGNTRNNDPDLWKPLAA